ncbi:MAG: hypothetical protein J6B04_03605 [Clostridia bacterium]|nr:hypothetical protein [Clostridia bacterium]
MKVKRVLKFYFCADRLEVRLNNLILKRALSSKNSYNAEACADDLIKLIEAKRELSNLYAFLNGVLKNFSCEEVKVLKFYAAMRKGLSTVSEPVKRQIRRVTVKFTRKCNSVELRFSTALKLVGEYYCLT